MAKLAHTASTSGVVVGLIAGFDDTGAPLVDYPDNPAKAPLAARSTVSLTASDVNRDAVILFENGDRAQPIVVGLLQEQRINREQPIEAEVDDEVVTIEGQRQIVLRCGKASITLTRAGKVLIKGEYVSSRSAGVNKVKGASIQLN